MGVALPDNTEAWADRLQARVNERESFREAAAGFSATFRFLVAPDDAYDGEPRVLTVVVDDGACVAAAGHDGDADYEFTLKGPYTAWRELLEGDADVASAVLDGAFEFEGSTMQLLQRRDAVAELVRGARAIDTEFPY
jgi:putative sterol carrier protein